MMADDAQGWTRGLARFGETWRAHRPASTPHWTAGLATFALLWHHVRQTQQPSLSPVHQPPPGQAALANLAKAAQAIRARGDTLNPWTAAGLRQDEVRNAAVLAALLSPHQTGDLALLFLGAFLKRIGLDQPDLSVLQRGYRVRTEDCPLGQASERVDLTIEGSGFMLGIEVKINAGEGLNQFDRYIATITSRARLAELKSCHVIVLARTRITKAGITPATWADIASAAYSVAQGGTSHNHHLLRAFAAHVSRF